MGFQRRWCVCVMGEGGEGWKRCVDGEGEASWGKSLRRIVFNRSINAYQLFRVLVQNASLDRLPVTHGAGLSRRV